jgi:DNA-binding response OmpR family regulator
VSGVSGAAGRPSAGLVIDRDQRRVFLDGREIELVFQEFELLEFLTAHPSRAFTRGQIVAGAWAGHRPPAGRTVDIHIHRLRRKLGPGYAGYLVTMQRVGYMFRPPRPAATPSLRA